MHEFERTEPGTTYGVCYMPKGLPDGIFEYIAGVRINLPEEAPAGMVVYEVPEQRYAVFEQHGSMQALFEMNTYIYQSWLPRSGYRRTDGPDLEIYTDTFNDFKEDSILYLYVPISEA
jgi:AraC family transcriptional regulator